MDRFKNVSALFVAGVLLSTVSGCMTAPNPKDPQQVAEVFWNAVIAGDYEEAATHVIPEDRDSFMTHAAEELKKLPEFPDRPQIRAKTNGNEGTALIENWEFDQGPEMIFRDGRWWIEK